MLGNRSLLRAAGEARRIIEANQILVPPVDIFELLDAYGLTVYQTDFKPAYREVAGYIDVEAGSVVLNAQDAPTRMRFTAAHELGHWCLHKDELEGNLDMGVVMRRPIGGETDTKEREANAFAAHLLVPSDMLKRYCGLGATLESLARLFGVSKEVIGYRLKDEGLVSAVV